MIFTRGPCPDITLYLPVTLRAAWVQCSERAWSRAANSCSRRNANEIVSAKCRELTWSTVNQYDLWWTTVKLCELLWYFMNYRELTIYTPGKLTSTCKENQCLPVDWLGHHIEDNWMCCSELLRPLPYHHRQGYARQLWPFWCYHQRIGGEVACPLNGLFAHKSSGDNYKKVPFFALSPKLTISLLLPCVCNSEIMPIFAMSMAYSWLVLKSWIVILERKSSLANVE